MDKKSLIIGYGNTYCHDDGVAFHIVNQIRKHLGFRELQPDEDGLDQLGHSLDTVVLHQLVPELIPTLGQYQTVVFVDAHMGTIPDDVKSLARSGRIGFPRSNPPHEPWNAFGHGAADPSFRTHRLISSR